MASEKEKVLYEALVRQTADSLHVYLMACTRDAALADEVFQDTLVVAWKRLSDYDSRRPFGAWTRGIARTILRAKLRERRESAHVDLDLIGPLDVRFEALEREAGDTLDEKLDALRRCIADLPDRDRDAIEGRYERGLRGTTLAAALETSLENARKIVQRARGKLLRCMKTRVAWE